MLTGTHIHYYMVCHRKLWLFANGINMEHNSETVADGKFVHESSYAKRPERFTEVSIGGIKVDYYDTATGTVHETKRSASIEKVHEWQLKYYIYIMQAHGIPASKGVLEYPRLKEKREVSFDVADRAYLEEIIPKAEQLIQQPDCPPARRMKICKSCAYHDFCWVAEDEADAE